MSTQQQSTAEKSVQTSDLSGSTTLLVSNNSMTPIHTENTATEVANTLVSMATGRQRAANVKQVNVINVSNSSKLPTLSLADYTTSHGVPTATALASQAKLTPTKHDTILTGDDDQSMSTDEYNPTPNDLKTRAKSTRGKLSRTISTSKNNKHQVVEPIQYGPIVVKPRRTIAPTLANGRKSKDQPLPPEEELKRKQRRDRNKEAAAKCRKKRTELREELEKTEKRLIEEEKSLEQTVQMLNNQKQQLELLLNHHVCARKPRLPTIATTANALNISKTDTKSIPMTTLLDSNNSGNNKRVTINFTNPQDLLAIAPLTRITTPTTTTADSSLPSTSSSSSNVPMITIHITPEAAQALLGSASVDKNKLMELLHQVSSNNSSTTTTTSDSTFKNMSTNSTS